MKISEADFRSQVEAAIAFGDPILIKRLLIVAKKRSDDQCIEKLSLALKKKGLNQESIEKQISNINPLRLEKIKSKYAQGASIKQLAISFGLKSIIVRNLIAKWEITDKEEIKTNNPEHLDDDFFVWVKKNTKLVSLDKKKVLNPKSISSWKCKEGHKFLTFNQRVKTLGDEACPICNPKIFGSISNKKQLNLRLKDSSLEKLSEIYSYWKNKRDFKFLNVENPNIEIFSSEVNFSKFLLETTLENLFIDLENEKQIDSLAKWIAEIRTNYVEVKNSWSHLKDAKVETWFSNLKKELEIYIQDLNQYAKNELLKKSIKEFSQVNEEFFEIIWPLAINRSHHIPDQKKESSQNELKISRLKKLYSNS